MKVLILVVSLVITVAPTIDGFSQEIKIGFITTSPLAGLEKAAAMASVEKASKDIGAQIALVSLEGGCTAEQTKSVMTKLKGAKSLCIIGSFCGAGIPFASEFSKEIEIPVISLNPVSRLILRRGYPWFFSETPKVQRWSSAVASEMEKLGVKGVSILAWDNPYGRAGLDYWKEAQKRMEVSSEATFPVRTADFGEYLAKTKKADGLVFISSDRDAVYGIQQALQFGLEPNVIGGIFSPTAEFFSYTQNVTTPIIFPILYPPDQRNNKEFFAKVSTLQGLLRFSQAVYRSKDAIDMVALAITRASHRSPKAIRDSFQSLTAKEVFSKGLSGRIKIDPRSNQWLQEFYVGQWSKGHYKTTGGPHNHEP
jgi:ABC-type branched-subunit amino acid transport system substrate-binding protein